MSCFALDPQCRGNNLANGSSAGRLFLGGYVLVPELPSSPMTQQPIEKY